MGFDLLQALRDAKPNASIPVPAGTYVSPLVIDKPVSLVAMGNVVLDGGGMGSVVRIATSEGLVRLAGFLIVGGVTPEGGGGVAVLSGKVELLQCTFRYNKAPMNGGGGLWVTGSSSVTVQRCRFEGNTGRQGGAVLVDEVATLKLSDSALVQNAAVEGGGVRVREGATAELLGCTLADNKVVGDGATGSALSVGGSSTRTPTVTVSHCILSERERGPSCVHRSKFPGALSFTRSLLPQWCSDVGGDNLFGPANFTMHGSEPYQLAPGSLAIGAAADNGFPSGAKDLSGRVRQSGFGKPELGAFAVVR